MARDTVGVVGAGTMGAGIAQVFAQTGSEVWLCDVSEAVLDRGRKAIEGSLARLEKKGKLSKEDLAATLERLRTTTRVEDLGAATLAVEAVFEDPAVKRKVFEALDAALPEGAVLASNTSSISITAIGAATRRPGSVVGMHFMNPVPVMRLVELVRGVETTDETFSRAREAVLSLGKVPVAVNDAPGFVSNRVLLPMINEAVYCLMEGVAAKEAIDEVMKLGMAHPLGPLALADLIGLDVCLAILEVLQRDLGDDKYRPCPLLRRMVDAGRLGRKTGRGFYDYTQERGEGR